jgi:predicted GNAT family acetyltransferase
MIRRLGEHDRERLERLLAADEAHNLYLLGNLAKIGFEADFCEFYGDVVENRVLGVVNRYLNGWVVYGEAEANWAGLGHVVDSHEIEAHRLQDNPGGVNTFLPYLRRYHAAVLVEDKLMALPPQALRPQTAPLGFTVRKAIMNDLDGLITLYANADDMARSAAAVELPLRDHHVWLATKNDVVVSAALTNAETATQAMIGGVYTRPEWRGNGLSQAICSGLCMELLAEGLQPLLYWHDAAAGHVYTKLGFARIGTWRSVRLERN